MSDALELFHQATSALSGPVVDPATGDLLVASQSGDIIRLPASDGRTKGVLFATVGGVPSGAAFDTNSADGVLYICDTARKAVVSLTEDSLAKVVDSFEERALRGPNSVCVSQDGVIYFSDSGVLGTTTLENPKGSVFAVSGNERILQPIAFECLAHPAGLCLSPAGDVLYIAETMRNRVLRAVQKPRGVFHVSVFYQFSGGVGPAAVTCDGSGNVYVARCDFGSANALGLVTILGSDGTVVGELAAPAPELTGIALGPKSNPYLFVTEASTKSVYRIHVSKLPV